MPNDEKKGITVKIDADLHAEVRQFAENHNMTMAEFVTLALTDELHPKVQEKEANDMGNMRTIAFQVPEELFQRIKGYLQRNNMTQRQFVLGLIEDELDRDLDERQSEDAQQEESQQEETSVEDEPQSGEEETENIGQTMGM